jgi:O-antigen/teichoic acid export membrane protein
LSDAEPAVEVAAMPLYRGGTGAIIAATALSVYLFQVIAGRSLGPEGFAPIGILWTVSFLLFSVLYLPVEQYVTRRLILGGGRWQPDSTATLTVAIPLVIGAVFVAATRQRFFEGEWVFVIVIVALMLSGSVTAVGRGFLAGRRRFFLRGCHRR